MGSIGIRECGQREPTQNSYDQERRILRLRFRGAAMRDEENPAPMQRQCDFGGQEVADENANCVGDSFADFSAILWIQQPPTAKAFPCPVSQQSPNFALER
jgi:hypothetical protein